MAHVDLHRGNCLHVLQSLPDASVDAVITDPPYSSGGRTSGERSATPVSKYEQGGQKLSRPTFPGDNRDQRSWHYWLALWLSECWRIVKPGGYVLMFSDWRQLPTATDALQAGGFIWRGVVAWDKGRAARAPHPGYFRHQCEYIVWGTNGPCVSQGGVHDGCFQVPIVQSDKHHLTGKPTRLMDQLVRVVPEGSVILDPFMGSGTTGVACVRSGRSFIGVELDDYYYQVAQRRITEVQVGLMMAAGRGLNPAAMWTTRELAQPTAAAGL